MNVRVKCQFGQFKHLSGCKGEGTRRVCTETHLLPQRCSRAWASQRATRFYFLSHYWRLPKGTFVVLFIMIIILSTHIWNGCFGRSGILNKEPR